jgi:hypothetical protein
VYGCNAALRLEGRESQRHGQHVLWAGDAGGQSVRHLCQLVRRAHFRRMQRSEACHPDKGRPASALVEPRQIMVDNVRQAMTFRNAAAANARVVTVPPKILCQPADHRYSRFTVQQFVTDGQSGHEQLESMVTDRLIDAVTSGNRLWRWEADFSDFSALTGGLLKSEKHAQGRAFGQRTCFDQGAPNLRVSRRNAVFSRFNKPPLRGHLHLSTSGGAPAVSQLVDLRASPPASRICD